MRFNNDTILKDMVSILFHRFGKKGLVEKIDELESRLQTLEAPLVKPRRGRPPLAKND